MWSPEMSSRTLSIEVAGRFLCVSVMALLLVACGFHLRGSSPLPAEMSVTYISGTGEFDTLYDDLRTALESQGASVTQERDKATAVLHILENKSTTDVLTVNLSGKALEYLIRQSIHFEVTAADGHMLLDEQAVTASRSMKFNSNSVLSSERERDTIRRELMRDVVNLAMLRISAAGKH
jgi:LPS-assembly lipoprotein